jgi:hypothetical protein
MPASLLWVDERERDRGARPFLQGARPHPPFDAADLDLREIKPGSKAVYLLNIPL